MTSSQGILESAAFCNCEELWVFIYVSHMASGSTWLLPCAHLVLTVKRMMHCGVLFFSQLVPEPDFDLG